MKSVHSLTSTDGRSRYRARGGGRVWCGADTLLYREIQEGYWWEQQTVLLLYLLIYLLTYLLAYLLYPWNRVLLEKLTGFQLFKKFPAFYETGRFITAFTSACHLSLSWASSIQSIHPPSHFLKIHINIIPHLRLILPSGLFPSGFPTKTLYTPPIRATWPAHLILLDLFTLTILGEQYGSFQLHKNWVRQYINTFASVRDVYSKIIHYSGHVKWTSYSAKNRKNKKFPNKNVHLTFL